MVARLPVVSWPVRLARLALALVAVLAAPALGGQAPAAVPGSELEVYLVTMGPGDMIWERFGHNAVGIRDRAAGTDLVYNWGVFDFGDSDFLPRFIRGEMRYRVEPYDAALALEYYRRSNRSVWVQELALTPAQRLALRQFVEWNAQEENKYYRYDYFADNCSTRARDALDRALGGALARQFGSVPSGRTFRDEARRLADMDLLYTGIDIGLGSPSDREMTRLEAMFVPMTLRDAVREVRIADSTGALVPLVAREEEVFAAARAADLPAPANHQPRYLVLGLVLALLIVFGERRMPAVGRAVASTWSAVAATFGVLLVILWGFTQHTWAYANVNLLFFNPLWILVAIWAARKGPLEGLARGVVVALSVAALVGAVLGLLRFPQRAEQVALLAMFPHAAVCAMLLRRREA